MRGLEQGAPPETTGGTGTACSRDQATDAHTTLRPASRVVVVVVVVPRLLTVGRDNGAERPASTPAAPPAAAGLQARGRTEPAGRAAIYFVESLLMRVDQFPSGARVFPQVPKPTETLYWA